MTDLLTPEEVRKALALSEGISPVHAISSDKFQRLCRDYLTLWDRNKELEKEPRRLHDLSENELMSWWNKGSRP